MIKNVLLVGNYPPPFGGISQHVALLHELLRNKKIESCVIDVSNSKEKINSGVIYSKSKLKLFFNIILSCRKLDIIHIHTNGHNFKSWLLILVCGLLSRLYSVPSVVTIHSGLSPAYISHMTTMKKIFLLKVLEWYSRVIAVNSKIKDALIINGIKNEKIEIISAYLGLLSESKIPENDHLKMFVEVRKPLLASIVAFQPEYGINLLYSLMQNLIKKHPNAGLVIICSGEGYREMQEQIDKKKLGDCICLVFDVESANVYYILKKSTLFLRATDFDGDAISVREALELGVPVIASRTDFRPEGVLTFKIGDIEDLSSKVDYALNSYERLKKNEYAQDINNFGKILLVYESIRRK